MDNRTLGIGIGIVSLGLVGYGLYQHFTGDNGDENRDDNGDEYTLVEGANYIIYNGDAIAATTYFSEIWDCIESAYYLYNGAWYPITSTHAIQNDWHMGITITSECAGIVLLDTIIWETE